MEVSGDGDEKWGGRGEGNGFRDRGGVMAKITGRGGCCLWYRRYIIWLEYVKGK